MFLQEENGILATSNSIMATTTFKDTIGAVIANFGSETPFLMVDGLETKKFGCGMLLVSDIVFKKHDIAIPVAAVNDERFIYVFGQNFGEVTIKGSVFLGPSSGTENSSGQGLQELMNKFYEEKRLSKSKKGINVSLGGKSNIKFKAYIKDITVQTGNIDAGEMVFSIDGWVAPTPTGSK